MLTPSHDWWTYDPRYRWSERRVIRAGHEHREQVVAVLDRSATEHDGVLLAAAPALLAEVRRALDSGDMAALGGFVRTLDKVVEPRENRA